MATLRLLSSVHFRGFCLNYVGLSAHFYVLFCYDDVHPGAANNVIAVIARIAVILHTNISQVCCK